jgi:hypothetical protein
MRLLLLSLLSVSLLPAECHSPGQERWAIKTSVPDNPNFAQTMPATPADLMKLGNPPGAKPKDAAFEGHRIPAFPNNLKVKEGDFLTVRGFLYLVATEDNDCEYHIQISDQPRTLTDKPTGKELCLIVEVARPDAFKDPELQKRAQAVRDLIKTKLVANQEPGSAGNVMQHAVFVQVSGQLFFDNAHLKDDGTIELRGKRGMKSQTLWELHPVFDLKILLPPPKS